MAAARSAASARPPRRGPPDSFNAKLGVMDSATTSQKKESDARNEKDHTNDKIWPRALPAAAGCAARNRGPEEQCTGDTHEPRDASRCPAGDQLTWIDRGHDA